MQRSKKANRLSSSAEELDSPESPLRTSTPKAARNRGSSAASDPPPSTSTAADHPPNTGKKVPVSPKGKQPVQRRVVRRKKGYLVKAVKEIRYLQRSTHLLIPRRSFGRLVRELCTTMFVDEQGSRWAMDALSALQEASEYFMVNLFEMSYLLALHARRVTLHKVDLQLARRIYTFM